MASLPLIDHVTNHDIPISPQIIDLTGSQHPCAGHAQPGSSSGRAPPHEQEGNIRHTLAMLAAGLEKVNAERDTLIQENQRLTVELQKAKEESEHRKKECLTLAQGQLKDKAGEISDLKKENGRLQSNQVHYKKAEELVKKLKAEKEVDKKAADERVALVAIQLKTATKQKEGLMKTKDKEIQDLKAQFREDLKRVMKEKDDEKVKREKLMAELYVDFDNGLQKFQRELNQLSSTTTANINITPQPQPKPQAQPPSDPRRQRPQSRNASISNTGATTQARMHGAPPPQATVSAATSTAKRNLTTTFLGSGQRKSMVGLEGEIDPSKGENKRQRTAANDTRPGKDHHD